MKELNYEKVFNTLVEETANYVTSNGLKAMVLGISGGIDSTVVAAICHEVSKKTGIPLIGRSLPIKNKSDEFDVSKLVGEAFCDNFDVIKIDELYRVTIEFIEIMEQLSMSEYPIASGNVQARTRMWYLYNLASIHKGLVMSTDNQTEYQLGFWTIHGDVGDFDPIQDLWKTEVYELAEWINSHTLGRIYDRNAIDRFNAMRKSVALTPTDGLGISNSDLDQIGAKSYDEVDDILQTLIPLEYWYNQQSDVLIAKEFNNATNILESKYSKDVVNKVWNRHLASEFKRKKAPIFIPRKEYEND
jgi:NAD+ synthetase